MFWMKVVEIHSQEFGRTCTYVVFAEHVWRQLAKCDDPGGASRAYLLQRMLLPGHPVFMAI